MTRSKRFRAILILALALPVFSVQTVARAGVISAEEFVSATDRTELLNSVNATLARDEVRLALQRHGVDPSLAAERVAALNDKELQLLADDLEQLPAGAGLLGTLGVVAIVVLVLELIGVIDIFKKF